MRPRAPAAIVLALVLAARGVAAQSPAPPASQPPPPAAPSDAAMTERSEPHIAAGRAFVAAAAAGNLAKVEGMISAHMRTQAGAEAVRQFVAGKIVPFFADHERIGDHATITATADQFGNSGNALYWWSERRGKKTNRPFVLYVVTENGKSVISNALVDRFVAGRHRPEDARR